MEAPSSKKFLQARERNASEPGMSGLGFEVLKGVGGMGADAVSKKFDSLTESFGESLAGDKKHKEQCVFISL